MAFNDPNEVKCHASCKRSKNIGPFAGCKCRCGGRMHASETLADMSAADYAKAKKTLDADVKLGAALVQARVFFAQRKRDEAKRGGRLSA